MKSTNKNKYIKDLVTIQINSKIGNKLDPEIANEIYHQTNNQIYNELLDKVYFRIRNLVKTNIIK